MTRSAGHLIVQTLETHGVQRVYAVPGESYLDVLDGLHDSSIETVVCRHEGGAGFMALAEGRLGDVPGIAMVTRGPGAANAMIAVHTAWQDATALVLFVGLIPVADRGRDAFQEFSLEGWFGTTAKRVLVLEDADRASELIAEALHLARSGRPGPVVVGLPEDLLVGTTAVPVLAPRPLPELVPSASDVAFLVERLAAAAQPLMVVGGDGWAGSTGQRLLDFAAAAGVPVAADWRAYDAVPHHGPAWAGWLGYGRAGTLADRLDEADLLVFLGCGRSDVLSDGYTRGLNAETILVLADSSVTMHAGRLDRHVFAPPAALVDALQGHATAAAGTRGDAWMAALAADQQRFATPAPDGGDAVDRGEAVDLGVAFGELERALPADRVLTYGAGNATLWGHRYLSHTVPNSLVGPRNGAMGLAVPAAVAASLTFPSRQVVAVCGDGDFFMNAQELSVCFAHGGTPLVVVVDNGIYGTIVAHQRARYPGRPSGTSMVNPDFAAWMRSFGGHGEYVPDTASFGPALERALASGKPALLHLRTDPETMGPRPLPESAPAVASLAGVGQTAGK